MEKKLALYGGEKTINKPFTKGMRYGDNELKHLKEALEQNTLFYWAGNKVKELGEKFKNMYGMKYSVATSSGTSAIHTALAAVGVQPGDEVITTPVTDMGTIIGIIFQNAVPVFADIDPYTYNTTAESIEKCITDKTKAIIAVHITGAPCEMDKIMEVARKHNIKVVEDCAQAHMARYKGQLVGTFGDIGCFSFNEFKQISAGDGGICIMNDYTLYEDALRFADKNYNRLAKTLAGMRDVTYIAPNYRMNELTGSVALAQLDKAEWICERRHTLGRILNKGLSEIDGMIPPAYTDDYYETYMFQLFRVDIDKFNTNIEGFVEALIAEGVPAQKGYIPSTVYQYPLFKTLTGHKGTHAPFDSNYYGKEISYPDGLCPVAEEVNNKTSVSIHFNEFLKDEEMELVVKGIKKVADYYRK